MVRATTDRDGFPALLSARVAEHFSAQGRPRTADGRMWRKLAFGAGLFLASYAALALWPLPGWGFVLAYLLHGFAHLFLLLNVGHDANHGAIARDARLNRALALTMDLCGVSSRLWRLLHHRAHHYTMNIHALDDAMDGRRLLRLSPDAPWRPWHRWQHVYALPLYALASLDWVLVRDVEKALRPRPGLPAESRFRPRDVAVLLTAKALYLGYMVALPILVFGYPATLVLAAFVLAHVVLGLGALLVFQTTHLLDGNAFPAARGDARGYAQHVLATTVDVATQSRLLGWWSGGLNAHVVHHLFPGTCHTHYPELSRLLRRTAAECGLAYRENPSMRVAVLAHLALLRRLGERPAEAGSRPYPRARMPRAG